MKPMRTTAGVTLIELVVVIAITSIIAAAVALFIRRPVEGYADAARRAALTDEADTALRRMTRDLRLALPNSVRIDGTGKFVEYIETVGGGRYRAEPPGNILDFSLNTSPQTFDVIGPVTVAPGNHIVVHNLNSMDAGSNAYVGDNRAIVATVVPPPPAPSPTITITPVVAFPLPWPSPAKRFHVVSGPVTYGCTGGQLIRYSGYAYNPVQVVPPAGATPTVLAANVDTNECLFVYAPGELTERIGTVSIILQINSIPAGGGLERVRMFQQAQVSNAP